MRNWSLNPPENQLEAVTMRKDLLALLLKRAERHLTIETYPDPKLFQTPYLMKRHGTGMQSYEWNMLKNHIELNVDKVAGFWPNIYIIDPRTITTRAKRDIDPKLLYPWIPRLDAVVLTHTAHIITIEIVDILTVHAIGELALKTQLFQLGYPHAFPLHHMQLLFTSDNTILNSMLTVKPTPPLMSKVRLMHYPASEKRIGAKDEPDLPKGVRFVDDKPILS